MEMRRLNPTAPWPERVILTAYWLVSGYGLRASRAIIALLLTIGLATIGYATVGFAPSSTVTYQPLPHQTTKATAYEQSSVPGHKPGWDTAFYHSIDSTTALLHNTGSETLTSYGRAIEIALRLLGPLLFGLTILAIRARVKR
jgi:hypothetical protein